MGFEEWYLDFNGGPPEDENEAIHRSDLKAAWEAAVAAERAKWVAAAWKAFSAGYEDQGWTVLYEMGATGEVPKPTSEGKP